MKNYIEVLKKCPLFYNITENDITTMLHCLDAKVVSFQKKETIIAEGEAAKYIGIVLSGAVQIIQIDYFGNRNIVTDVKPSELFGESFACAGIISIPVDVVASTVTEILFIDCLRILHSCSNACIFHRHIIYNIMKIVAMKNIMFHQKIEITSKRSTKEKLIAYLLLQAKKHNSNSFEIPYNRQELADYLEVDRSGLSVEISKLCHIGLIEANKKNFKILKNINEHSM
ncbi:Crp/Fnr family transcriptional regulator [Clostridium sp. MD294]|uniref:Crp/Fnr family transcriptional regulator n=1 Tax=Clostridium sp. MD294 TaxID=97138 RepID=UPI0002C90F2C|nr:Crp/Fnr family transcriptional regulator [Clostridium sp. MD294]NDO45910.1 Crp/Fnr family transcriptional regulator [Clostridium sp. MD294]USF30431.1 hypothetical protein C820_001872 [Clostridium sp. MD294]